MLKNYLRIAFRNLARNKMQSLINIAGLSAGIAVAMLIGLWIWDELSFDRYHRDYDAIAQVMQHQELNSEVRTQGKVPIPLGEELRTTYGSEFKKVVMSSVTDNHILAVEGNKLVKTGNYMEADAPALFGLTVIKGASKGLASPSSIMLSESVAGALFGSADPIDKMLKFDDNAQLRVTGVYKDLPLNTTLSNVLFIVPWELQGQRVQQNINNWGNNGWLIYVQLAG